MTLCQKFRSQPDGEFSFYVLDTIDAKSSALLTHVSIMIAATVAMYFWVKDEPLWAHIVLIEILGYIIISIGCLRNIMSIYPKAGDSDVDVLSNRILKIVERRRKIYITCLVATAAMTIALIVTIATHTLIHAGLFHKGSFNGQV